MNPIVYSQAESHVISSSPVSSPETPDPSHTPISRVSSVSTIGETARLGKQGTGDLVQMEKSTSPGRLEDISECQSPNFYLLFQGPPLLHPTRRGEDGNRLRSGNRE